MAHTSNQHISCAGEEGEINPDAVEAAADDDTVEQLQTKLERALKCISDLKGERKSFDSMSADERTRVQVSARMYGPNMNVCNSC